MLDSYLSLPSEESALIEGRKPRGCGWPENSAFLLEELLREDGCFDLGCRCNRPSTYRRLQGRACRFVTRRSQLTHDQQSTLYHLFFTRGHIYLLTTTKRLMGASLLVFANKTDVGSCMTDDEIRQVCRTLASR